ncbi:hypothetical protein M407DRAFT_27027 [Tulasnella calospora MUT 4182]|uniref:FAD-binding PCMH-type domain-containing protein n=1 Tax=Tulasnella calospora MUT 4182 TaxID=1051891 RepID=A0A0C3QD69_9AGAM|nr:hypothetical protein M407DRAFT_27027 [Tulasnella calospora MUT 4182]
MAEESTGFASISAESLVNFRQRVKGTVSQPGDPEYNLSKWAPNSIKPSKVIVTPAVVEDIAEAVKFARAQGLTLGVRGGGHSSSTASATDGLLIDMRNMTLIRIDEPAKLAHIEAGARTNEVEAATIKHGLGACVGACSQVSVGGYILSGGVGYSTGTYGLAADNLVAATVVLATGEIARASESENPDLFWALRGGGSNFGVVSEVVVRLHPQRPDAYAIAYFYIPDKLPEVVEAIRQWLAVRKGHEAVQLRFSLDMEGKPVVIVTGVSNSTQEGGEKAFNRFRDIGPVKAINVQVPWQEVSNLANAANEIPGNKLCVGAHIDVFDFEQAKKAYDALMELAKSAPFSIVIYEFYAFDKVASVPVESAAFSQRDDFVNVICGVFWMGEEFSPQARDECLKLKKVVSGSSSTKAQESLGYVNTADIFSTLNETDDYARKLFGPNYARLQQVKRKYDPDMVFDRWFAIRPAT